VSARDPHVSPPALHPLAAHFDDVAGAYERGRPEYALAVVGAIAAELRIAPGARVLDLAAGDGKADPGADWRCSQLPRIGAARRGRTR
jgi:hypothetical protein